MNENPKEAGKLSRFFEEKGFYIILFLCVAAIGIAGYVLFFDPAGDTAEAGADLPGDSIVDTGAPPEGGELLRPGGDENTGLDDYGDGLSGVGLPADSDASVDAGKETEDEPVINGDAVIRDAVETIAEGKKQETTQKAPEKSADTAPTFFVRPVAGEVLREFSGDELVYERTMGDWRTHNGVDFLAVAGDPVYAVADGTVADVYRDEFYGTGVLVDHGGGLRSIYLGLIENAAVTVGQKVTAGDTLGAVSTQVLFESLEQPHVHVEMTKDGVRVDPMEYIPQ